MKSPNWFEHIQIYNSDNSSSLNVGLDFFKTKITGSEDSKEGKKEFTFITSKNLKELKGAYEFFASNSDTEWGYSEFEGKSKVGLLVTSHSEGTPEKGGTLRNWVDIAGKVLDINKSARLIYASHSHPGKFSEWSQWPAYPSGFTYLGKVKPEEGGDRDNYEYYEKYYKDRIPSMFNIFVPSKPKLDVMYDSKHFKTEYKK
jgi:hypothetical protein